MAVGVSGLRGPSAASRVATEVPCTEEGPAHRQHQPMVVPPATETQGRRMDAVKDPVRLTVYGARGQNGRRHRLLVEPVEHLEGSGVATIQNEPTVENRAMETTQKSSTLILHPVQSTVDGVPGRSGVSAASLAAKVDTRRGLGHAINRLLTTVENCARETHSRVKSAPDHHAQFLEAGATGTSGLSAVPRVDSGDRRFADGPATILLRCTMENNAMETHSIQSAVSSNTARSTEHGARGLSGHSTPLISENERIRWTTRFQKKRWTF